MGRPVTDMTGQDFGRLHVLDCAGRDKQGKALWRCWCECGTVFIAAGYNIRKGNTSSCGCYKREVTARNGTANRKHGHNTSNATSTPTYRSWTSMKTRCLNPKHMGYPNYGGRGITVCDRWMQFENFLEDIGERPEGKTLDRIDVNGNYEPGNVRWATRKEQAGNRRRPKRPETR